MRIRSIKPEFWRSADTADLDMFTRLLFIGLWNYVDDNGVGEDDVHLIRSDLFPRDRNVDELSQRIHGSLTELSNRGQIDRYTHRESGRAYFYVAAWHHQKINRPTESRKPLPTSDDCEVRESSVNPPGVLTEDSAPRARAQDQGIKGSREQGSKGTPYPRESEPATPQPPTKRTGSEKALARFDAIPVRSIDAYRIAEAFSASLPTPIETGLLAGIGTQIDKCLQANIPPAAVAAGLKAWTHSDSWSPTQIPNFVHKANNHARNGKPTEKALGHEAALHELLEEVTTL